MILLLILLLILLFFLFLFLILILLVDGAISQSARQHEELRWQLARPLQRGEIRAKDARDQRRRWIILAVIVSIAGLGTLYSMIQSDLSKKSNPKTEIAYRERVKTIRSQWEKDRAQLERAQLERQEAEINRRIKDQWDEWDRSKEQKTKDQPDQ